MGTKLNPGEFDCYENAAPDEPMFVLLARDKHAPTLVWLWATLRELDGENPAKVKEARDCVNSMLAWQRDHDKRPVGLGQAGLCAVMELMRAANYAFQNAPPPAAQADMMRMWLASSEIEMEPERDTRTYPPPTPPPGYRICHSIRCSGYRGSTAPWDNAACDCKYEVRVMPAREGDSDANGKPSASA